MSDFLLAGTGVKATLAARRHEKKVGREKFRRGCWNFASLAQKVLNNSKPFWADKVNVTSTGPRGIYKNTGTETTGNYLLLC
jgi:hypothetical protein